MSIPVWVLQSGVMRERLLDALEQRHSQAWTLPEIAEIVLPRPECRHDREKQAQSQGVDWWHIAEQLAVLAGAGLVLARPVDGSTEIYFARSEKARPERCEADGLLRQLRDDTKGDTP